MPTRSASLTKDLPEIDGRLLDRRHGRRHQFGLLRLGVQGLGRPRPLAEGDCRPTSRAACPRSPACRRFVFAPPSLPGAGGGLPISVVIQSTGDPSQVYEVAEEIKNKAQASGRFIVVQNSLAFDAPQVTVTIDRDRAAALNLPVARHRHDARACSSAAARWRSSTAIRTATTSSCRCRRSIRDNPEKLGEFFVRSVNGEMVPLSAVVIDQRPTPRRRRSSSSTSSTRRRSRRCRCPA